MKLKSIIPLLLGTVTVLPACAPVTTYTNMPPAPLTMNTPVAPAQLQTDAKVLGAVATLNQNEIAFATLAQHKATNPSVRKYADWMFNEHNQNLQETLNLSRTLGIAPQHGPIAIKLQSQGRRELAALNHANGIAFDKLYISTMIQAHSAAIGLLNNLIKIAASPILIKQLESTRHHVRIHLQKARAIQKEVALG